MSNTFKWSIQKLRVAPQQDDKTNVVIQADWLCVAMNEENIVQAASSGSKNFTLGDSFTPFNQLTENQILEWCFAPETVTETDLQNNVTTTVKHLKVDAEAQVTGQIERQLAQKASEPTLPWALVAQPE
jgi:hypothetical protein